MKIREAFKTIGKGIYENRDALGAIVLGVGMVIFSVKFGIPMGSYTLDNDEPCVAVKGNTMMVARNADEAKILSLYDSVKESDFDSSKRRIADDIYEIANGSVDESTRTLTIFVLNELAKKCDFGSSKRYITDLIKEV